jgi:hypothetical protein
MDDPSGYKTPPNPDTGSDNAGTDYDDNPEGSKQAFNKMTKLRAKREVSKEKWVMVMRTG